MQYEAFLPIEYATDPEKRKEILHIVSKLSANQRLALVAHFYGSLSVQETATAMNVPVWVTAKYLDDACAKVIRELGMENVKMTATDNTANASVLKEIFEWYEAEIVTDEMTERVLDPVLQMIREKKFTRPRWHRYSWLVRPVLTVAAVVALIVTVAITQGGGITAENIVIPDSDVPLVAMASDYNVLNGNVYLEDKGFGGIEIVLVNAENNETVRSTVSGENGAYSLVGISSGIYRLRVLLPKGMALVDTDADGNVLVNHKSELAIGIETKTVMESVDIQVWLTD